MMNWIEAIATIFGIICVVLTIKRNIWCWLTGLIQVVLFIYIFFVAKLYSDMILHIIYIFLQLYGWYHWLHGSDYKELKLTKLNNSIYTWIGAGVVGTVVLGITMSHYTDAAAPYADAFITVMSLIAQWLLTQKKLETWYFWIAVNVVAIGVYSFKNLYFTTGLYIVFFGLAISGLIEWRRVYLHSLKPVTEE